MLNKVIMGIALAACSAGPGSSGSSSTALASTDGGVDAPTDAPPPDPMQIPVEPLLSFANDESQVYAFDAPAGPATVEVTVNGNSGDVDFDDGEGHGNCVTVSIDGGPPCASMVREDNLAGCFTHCSMNVMAVEGQDTLTIGYHQWNGRKGWTVMAGTITVTPQS